MRLLSVILKVRTILLTHLVLLEPYKFKRVIIEHPILLNSETRSPELCFAFFSDPPNLSKALI